VATSAANAPKAAAAPVVNVIVSFKVEYKKYSVMQSAFMQRYSARGRGWGRGRGKGCQRSSTIDHRTIIWNTPWHSERTAFPARQRVKKLAHTS